MKVHFAAAYATSVSIDAVDTVDVGSATALWDAPGVIFLKLLAIAILVALNGFFVASEFAPSLKCARASLTLWSPKATGSLGTPGR